MGAPRLLGVLAAHLEGTAGPHQGRVGARHLGLPLAADLLLLGAAHIVNLGSPDQGDEVDSRHVRLAPADRLVEVRPVGQRGSPPTLTDRPPPTVNVMFVPTVTLSDPAVCRLMLDPAASMVSEWDDELSRTVMVLASSIWIDVLLAAADQDAAVGVVEDELVPVGGPGADVALLVVEHDGVAGLRLEAHAAGADALGEVDRVAVGRGQLDVVAELAAVSRPSSRTSRSPPPVLRVIGRVLVVQQQPVLVAGQDAAADQLLGLDERRVDAVVDAARR